MPESTEKKPTITLGGAANPNRSIELRNMAEGKDYAVADGGYNPDNSITTRNNTPEVKGEALNATNVIDNRNRKPTRITYYPDSGKTVEEY